MPRKKTNIFPSNTPLNNSSQYPHPAGKEPAPFLVSSQISWATAGVAIGVRAVGSTLWADGKGCLCNVGDFTWEWIASSCLPGSPLASWHQRPVSWDSRCCPQILPVSPAALWSHHSLFTSTHDGQCSHPSTLLPSLTGQGAPLGYKLLSGTA